ncbi:MAG: hypothetical protein F6I01_002085 [Aerococcus sanguinicola]
MPNPNLLIKGLEKVSNDKYQLAGYETNEELVIGDIYTFTLYGELGEGRHVFKIYDQASWNHQTTLEEIAPNLYSASFNFNPNFKDQRAYLNVYMDRDEPAGITTIHWAKLEKGSSYTPQVAMFDCLYQQIKNK